MNEELLTRLVDALESINDSLVEVAVSLDNLDKNLTGCISSTCEGSKICITGDISICNYN